MELISQLISEHREIETMARDLLLVVAAPIPDPASVAALRWRLARLLIDHCAREADEVYGRLLTCGDAEATATAWRFREEHGGLHGDVQRYVAAWPVGRIGAEWSGFQRETRALIAALAARVVAEEAVLYPLLVQIDAQRAARRAAAAAATVVPIASSTVRLGG